MNGLLSQISMRGIFICPTSVPHCSSIGYPADTVVKMLLVDIDIKLAFSVISIALVAKVDREQWNQKQDWWQRLHVYVDYTPLWKGQLCLYLWSISQNRAYHWTMTHATGESKVCLFLHFAGNLLMWTILALLTVLSSAVLFHLRSASPPACAQPAISFKLQTLLWPHSLTSLPVQHLLQLQHNDLALCYPKLRWHSVFDPLELWTLILLCVP